MSYRNKSHVGTLRGSTHSETPTFMDVPWCPVTFKQKPNGYSVHSHLIQLGPEKTARRTLATTKINFKQLESTLDSETQRYRLLQCYMYYRTPKGEIRKGRVALDTQSNMSYSLRQISTPRPKRDWEPQQVFGISGESVAVGEPLQLTIVKNGQSISIDTNAGPPGALDKDVIALLSCDHVKRLGIDLNLQIDQLSHTDVFYRQTMLKADTVANKKGNLLASLQATLALRRKASQTTNVDMHYLQNVCERNIKSSHTTKLSDRIVRAYLDKNGTTEFQTETLSTDSIKRGALQPEEDAQLDALIERHKNVFAKFTNTLPSAMKDVAEHVFKLKPDAKSVKEPRPHFSTAKEELLRAWTSWAVKAGLIERASTTSYASRLILCPKYNATSVKGTLPDGIRVAWAGVRANMNIIKTVPTYPDPVKELYKAARYKYKFTADGLKQYWSVPLHPSTREITAFWTPDGLYQYTRLAMGSKNAATVAQNAYTDALNGKLPPRSRDNIANFADDFVGGADTIQDLLVVFEDFLVMCDKAGITLKPSKIHFGVTQCQFYGFNIGHNTIEPSERNLCPIQKMSTPQNRSELRSVMGVFNQFSNFIKNYSKRGSPASTLNTLMSTKLLWHWDDTHERAFQTMRQLLLEHNLKLSTPNHQYPLHLETDGSDDGWGAVLFQVIDGKRHVIRMWSKQWDESFLKHPPYHKEAKAWMNAMTQILPFAMGSPYPIEVFTDHSPLTWIKHTSGKGAVSQFVIDTLSAFDYNMHYIKGPDNITADALSRFPCLGPRTLTCGGSKEALSVLLSALTGSNAPTNHVWLDMRKDTTHLLPTLKEWIRATNKRQATVTAEDPHCYTHSATAHKVPKVNYSLAILAPHADKLGELIIELFKSDKPFAILIPSDLVSQIPRTNDGYRDDVAKQLEQAYKITLLGPSLTWFVHNVQQCKGPHHVLLNSPSRDIADLTEHVKAAGLKPGLPPDIFDRQKWVKIQASEANHIPARDIKQDSDGLKHYCPEGTTNCRVIVPKQHQRDLVKWQHSQLCHASAKRMAHILKDTFYWRNMSKTIHDVVRKCSACALLNAQRHLAHKHFRAKLFCTPRTTYGMDFHGVAMNKLGFNNILGIIDLATNSLVLVATKGRTAAVTAHNILYEIVTRKGCPLLIHSDAAQEFVSTAMKSLSAIIGCKQTTTKAHNPRGNATIERIWQFTNKCLRQMSKAQYANFHLYMPIISHVWNSLPNSTTGISPFEAEHGMKPRSIAESLTEIAPTEGLPATATDLATIATSVTAFTKIAAEVQALQKVRTANKLNANGTSKHTYKIGDQVAFFIPPTEEEANKANRKAKHLMQFKGPATIVASLSKNNTTFRLSFKGRNYDRQVLNMSPYRSDDQPQLYRLTDDTTVTIGSLIAVKDESEHTQYHLGQVLEIVDNNAKIWYYATTTRHTQGKWRPLYGTYENDTSVTFNKPLPVDEGTMRYTGLINLNIEEDDTLVVMPNIALTKSGALNASSKKRLAESGLTHHVRGETW